MSAALPAYGVEDMTFEIEEEKIPIYRPPKEDDEDGDSAAPGPSRGKNPPRTKTAAIHVGLLNTHLPPDWLHSPMRHGASTALRTHAGGEPNGADAGAAEGAGDEPVAERKMGAAEAVIEKHKERAKRAR